MLVAAAILVQAEALSRYLPRLVRGEHAAVTPLAAWLVAAALVRMGAAALTERSATRASIATRTVVRTRVLDHLARIRPDQRAALGPSRVGALTTTALDALEPWIRTYLPALMLAVVVPLAAGLRILLADRWSALILIIVVPLVPFFMVLIGRATEAQQAKQWDSLQRLAGRFLDVITGLPTLRLFGRAEAQVERVRVVTDRYRQATVRTLRVAFLSALVLELLATLTVALVAVTLGLRLTHGSISLQTALIVLLLAPECLLPIRRVGAAFHASTAGTDAAVEITEALALPVRPEGTLAAPTDGPLVATDVSVTDHRRGVRLAPVSLRLDAGELVALSGPSGAGKSTLLDVLRGALDPDGGQVLVGERAMSELTASARTAAVTWVPQHPQPFGATVASAAALGHAPGAPTDRAVAAALDQVGLTALADSLPTQISGGERRRLAVARALVGVHLGTVGHLLLDEPTAQLDPVAADRVIAALRWAADAGVGTLAVTHDARLTGAADRVVAVAAAVGSPDPTAAPAPIASAPAARPRPLPLDTFEEIDALEPVASAAGASASPGAIRWLLRAARPQRARLLGAQLLGVLTEVCTVGLAATAAWLIMRAAEHPDFADLAVAAVAVRTFAIGKGVLRYGERLASHDATLRLLADLRATAVARLARLAPTGLPDGGRGELLTRLVDDIDRLQDLFLRVLGPLISTLVVACGAAVLAGLIDPAGGAVLAVAVLVVGVALPGVAHRATRRRGAALADERGAVAATTIDLAEHVEELVACRGETAWRDRIETGARRADALDSAQGRVSSSVAAVAAAAPGLTCAAVVAAVGPAHHGLSGPALGVLVLLPLAVIELLAPLSAAGDVLARVEASAARVLAILDRPDPVPEPAAPVDPPTDGGLALRHVDVGWPGAAAQVTGIDLALAEGSRTVISGPSGSGKSTIANTLVSFLTPAAGDYRIGGAPAPDLGGEAVRRLVTWCQQDPWFADSTLADNLRVASSTATDADLWDALRVVHLDRWAEGLPDGLGTRLERDAEAMSGGERQRLALARALLGGHRAIVLDEPTAHLDAATASAVLADLLAASRDQAVVVIAHEGDAAGIADQHVLVPAAGGPSRWRAAGGSAQG